MGNQHPSRDNQTIRISIACPVSGTAVPCFAVIDELDCQVRYLELLLQQEMESLAILHQRLQSTQKRIASIRTHLFFS